MSSTLPFSVLSVFLGTTNATLVTITVRMVESFYDCLATLPTQPIILLPSLVGISCSFALHNLVPLLYDSTDRMHASINFLSNNWSYDSSAFIRFFYFQFRVFWLCIGLHKIISLLWLFVVCPLSMRCFYVVFDGSVLAFKPSFYYFVFIVTFIEIVSFN